MNLYMYEYVLIRDGYLSFVCSVFAVIEAKIKVTISVCINTHKRYSFCSARTISVTTQTGHLWTHGVSQDGTSCCILANTDEGIFKLT